MGLADRYQAMPRSGRWLLWSALGLALYFPLVDYPLAKWRDLSDRAGARQAQLRSFHERSRDGLESELALGAAHHGRLVPPAKRPDVTDELDRALAGIFEARGVGRYNLTSRAASMTRGSQVARAGQKLERLLKEINFESDPQTALEVLADLERLPIIVRASALQLQRLEDQGTVRARLTVEAWAIAEAGGGS